MSPDDCGTRTIDFLLLKLKKVDKYQGSVNNDNQEFALPDWMK